MAIILPNQSLVLNAYAVLVDETPGNAALAAHEAFIVANGADAYKAALDGIFANSTDAALATSMLDNLGLGSVFTQAQAEAYIAANAGNRVGAMMDLAGALYNYNGDDADILAAQTDYVNTVQGSYNYSLDESNVAGATLDGDLVSGGQSFELTTDLDSVLGTSGDDTIIALDEDATTDTLTLGDSINGGLGSDTLKIFSDNNNLSLAAVTLSSVENLTVINAQDDWDDINIANNAFETITIDVNDLESGGLQVDNVDAATAVTLTNIFAYDQTNYIYFNTDSTSATGNTTVTISDVDMSDDNEYFDVEAAFTAATTVNTTVNLMDIDDQENGDDGSYDHTLDLGTTEGVAVNATFNVENVTNADSFDVNFDVDQDGDSVNNITVNLTDTDNVDVDIDLDNDGNGTSATDVVTVNLDNVANSNDAAEFYTTDAETFNVNVLSDSELENIGAYYNNDGTDMGATVVNLTADADLKVGFWDLNDSAGVTEDTTFNITGAGNVTIADFDDGSSNVTVAASTATGDITLAGLEAEVVSVTTGAGDDSIELGGFETSVDTGAGDDTVDTVGLDFGDVDAKKVDGGADTDTVAIINSSLVDAAYMANVVNFETLEIAGANNIAAYDMDVMGFTDIKLTNTAAAVAVTVENVAADALFTLTNTDDMVALGSVTYSLKDASAAADEVAVVMHTVDTAKTADNVAIAASTSAALNLGQDSDSKGIEAVTLTSNATTASVATESDDAWTSADYTNTLALDATEMTKLVIDGNAQAAVTFADATALTFVDASANEAGVSVDATALSIVAGVTFKGSDAADIYLSSANGDLIQANGGADDVTLGAGEDTVRFAAASDSQLTLIDTTDPVVTPVVMDVAKGYDVVTGFTTGDDLIELSSLLNLGTGDARSDVLQLGSMAGGTAADLDGLIGDGVDFFDTGVVDRAVAFADDTTDGWMFIDANTDGNFTQADDMVIQLAGVTSLVVTDVVFG